MALNLTPQELLNLQRLQNIQSLYRAQQIQQEAATNGPTAYGTQVRQRSGHAAAQLDLTQRMLDEVGPANQQNRRAFKAWYRRHGQTMRAKLAQQGARMLREAQLYGISSPERFIIESTRDELRNFIQGLEVPQKLALFDLATDRQAERGDITGDKVAVFNTVNGRPGDMPLAIA